MLTKITICNFKSFEKAEVPLDNGMVFIGPNNSGKTSALQALSLWYMGLQKWIDKKWKKKHPPTKRQGVVMSRSELITVPVREMDLIWWKRKPGTSIELTVEGTTRKEKKWRYGLEFDYGSTESLYCRPLHSYPSNEEHSSILSEASEVKVFFLPSMSGIASEEALIQEGRINVHIGEGRTAEVLRNLCYQVYEKKDKKDWEEIVKHIEDLFGVMLHEPRYIPHRGALELHYSEKNRKEKLDLPSSGRGMQQVLLLLAYLYNKPKGSVFLLDEPDAHLEILRQKQIYEQIIEVADKKGAQVIAASHSEVLLNKAADRDEVVAFIGKPHRISKASEIKKALQDIGWEYYTMAEENGWMLYLEGDSDLQILRAFADRLNHEAKDFLSKPPVKILAINLPQNARDHFHGLKAAKEDLCGILILDRVDKELYENRDLIETKWHKREIENYLCSRATLLNYARSGLRHDDLFDSYKKEEYPKKMNKAIEEIANAQKILNKPEPFSDDIKASDDFLDPLFKLYSKMLGDENRLVLKKADYYKLVQHIPDTDIDPEITEKLDAIVKVAKRAKPG